MTIEAKVIKAKKATASGQWYMAQILAEGQPVWGQDASTPEEARSLIVARLERGMRITRGKYQMLSGEVK